jgi:hypothetical protein
MWNLATAAAGASANGAAQQRLVDAIKAEIRDAVEPARPRLFRPAPPRPEPSTDPIEHRMVEEIECIRRHLDLLGSTLANDLVLVRRYATQLQSIDMVNQLLGQLGIVIGAEDKAMAVEQVANHELKARLKRRPLAGM